MENGYFVMYCHTPASRKYATESQALEDMQQQIEEHKQKLKTWTDQLANIANNGCKSVSDSNLLYKTLDRAYSVLTSDCRLVLSKFIHGKENANDKRQLHQIIKHIIESDSE